LTTLFERRVGPDFHSATGYRFLGEGKGSVAAANLMKDGVRMPDVFISADPAVNLILQGRGVSWWVTVAATEMVLGWSPRSRFRSDFEAARDGQRTWESVLKQPGLRLGRTDPELDPKGYRTLFLFQLDDQRTTDVGSGARILGADRNPSQVFPEEQLVVRLQEGQLDAGILYRIEAVEAGLPFLRLPAEINQGDPALAATYARASYTNRKGQTFYGSPILYTITIPAAVRNRGGASAFVRYLLGRGGEDALGREGLEPVAHTVGGDPAKIPSELRPLVRLP